MATNPRIPESLEPESRNRPGLHPQPPEVGKSGVLLAIIVAALLLAAVFYFMPRAPKASPSSSVAQVPQQPTGAQVQMQNLRVVPGPVGNTVTIQGIINNNGQTTINGIEVLGSFLDSNGKVLRQQNAKVLGLKQEGQALVPDDLTQIPIKPNDSRPFRVTFDGVPQGDRNHTRKIMGQEPAHLRFWFLPSNHF